MNLKQIGSLAHATENLLDLARKGEIVLAGATVDVVFEAMDVMKKMLNSLLEAIDKGMPVQSYSNLEDLITRIKACTCLPETHF